MILKLSCQTAQFEVRNGWIAVGVMCFAEAGLLSAVPLSRFQCTTRLCLFEGVAGTVARPDASLETEPTG